MFYDALKRDRGFKADPLKSLIVPRPATTKSTPSSRTVAGNAAVNDGGSDHG